MQILVFKGICLVDKGWGCFYLYFMMFNEESEVMRLVKQHTPITANFTDTKTNQQTPSNGRTAAIMFTDIVGYTSLMEQNQQEALEVLENNRNMHKYNIEQHNGTWIKEMGDGILISFESAAAAVECAISIQNDSKSISNLQLRIGIHFGEVIISNNDVFGMVVNIASRIQCLAKPGQILVSAAVANGITVENNCRVNLVGNRKLKNVSKTVQIHKIGDLSESEVITWWSTYTNFPIQKVMAVLLMLSSLIRL